MIKHEDYKITLSNTTTGEAATFSIFDNERIKFSDELEKIVEAKEGAIIGENKNIKIEKIGKNICNPFHNIKKGNKIPFYTGKINYKYYYNPNNKNKFYYLILNGLKDYPDKTENAHDYESLKEKLISSINFQNFDTLCSIPGHVENVVNDNSIARMIKDIKKDVNSSINDGSQILQRLYTVEESKTVSGVEREEKFLGKHLNSIIVNDELKQLVENKNILLLDDVVTSGTSMRACKYLLLEAGAKTVTCFAFAAAHTHWKIDDIINTGTSNSKIQFGLYDPFLPF